MAASLTGVQVGLALVITRAVLDGDPASGQAAGQSAVGPVQVALLRYLVGVVVLVPFFLRARFAPVARRDLGPVLGLGVVQFGLLILLLNAAVQRIPAGQTAVIFALFPLITLVIGALAGGGPLGLWRLVGTGLSFAGVALCLLPGLDPGGGGDALGAGLAFAAALAGAICALFYRPYLTRYPTLQVGTLAMAAAVAALAPLAWLEAPHWTDWALPLASWAGIGVIGLSSGAGYLLWLTALRHLPAADASIFLGLSPLAASLLGAVFLSEPLGWPFGLGLVLALAGLTLALGSGKLLAISGRGR